MFQNRALAGLALIGLAAGAGCSNGGADAPIPAAKSYAQFSITVPTTGSSASASQRNPKFVAPSGTQSVTIVLASVDGVPTTNQTTTTVNISSSNSACTAGSGSITCTATAQAVPGADLFAVSSYSQPNGGGTLIATGTAAVQSSYGMTTVTPVTLTGNIASIAVALAATPIAVVGSPATVPVTIVAKDANGATIMGTYSNPITLTDSDATGATTLSSTTVLNSGATVTLAYNGSPLSAAATISASAQNVKSSAITGATFTPNADASTANGTTLNFTEKSSWTATIPGSASQPPQLSTATYSDTYTTGASFNGVNNLTKVHDVYVAAGQPSTNSNVNDIYFNWITNGSTASLSKVGAHYLSTSGSAVLEDMTTVFSGTGTVVAMVPFNGANAWNQNLTYTQNMTGSYGTASYSYNNDGSYSDNITNSDGSKRTDAIHADGSAVSTYTNAAATTVSTTTVGVPVPKTGGGYVIPVTVASGAPGSNPTPGPVTNVPDWYPGNAAPPSPLQSDKMTDKGQVTIPTSCNLPSTFGTKADLIEEKMTQLDPVVGFVLSATGDNYYVSGVGDVCVVVTDSVDNYDTTAGTLYEHDDMSYTDTLTSTATLSAVRAAQSLKRASSIVTASASTFASQTQNTIIERIKANALKHRSAYLHHV